ncbi:MAG: hypothetical protein ACRECY_16980 [Phyllobacterium sp.]
MSDSDHVQIVTITPGGIIEPIDPTATALFVLDATNAKPTDFPDMLLMFARDNGATIIRSDIEYYMALRSVQLMEHAAVIVKTNDPDAWAPYIRKLN